jgi:parallel beta-helix repeat protein
MYKTICLIILALSTQICNATIINVPSEQPTIQAGINAASLGDTVLVSPGLYIENIYFQGKGIVVRSVYGADVTVIKAANPDSATVSFVNGEPKGAKISGFTIMGGGNSGIFSLNSSPTITNNIVTSNVSISNNDGGGIDLNYSSYSQIRDNVIYGNTAHTYGSAIHQHHCTSDTIAYNIIYNNQGYGEIRCLASTAHIYNNTIFSSFCGIIAQSEGGSADIRNNIIFGASDQGIRATSDAIAEASYNCLWQCNVNFNENVIVGDSNIETNPLLLDSANNNFMLLSSSPCINAGDTDPFYNDPNGTRNDIGAIPFSNISYPVASNIRIEPYLVSHIVYLDQIEIHWKYIDVDKTDQFAYEIEIGTDDDWVVAEMWSTGQIISSDTSTQYLGAPLSFFNTYFMRLRLNDGIDWGEWNEFRFFTRPPTHIYVPNDFPTIQAAINVAVTGDTVFIANGVYSGEGNNNIDFHGKSIMVKSENNNPDGCIIDCEGNGRGFYFHSEESYGSILDGITIKNAIYCGIECNNSSPTIENCVISYCADWGLYCESSSAYISKCTFSQNSGGWAAIGCVYDSDPLIANCLFSYNTSTMVGGLLCYTSNPIIRKCTFVFNSGDMASAIYCYQDKEQTRSNPTIENSIIAFNGPIKAIYCEPSDNVTFTCSDIYGNPGGDWTGQIYSQLNTNGNISENPFFCDTSVSDFRLHNNSPCLPEYSGCGLIGAYDMGCWSTEITNMIIENEPDFNHVNNNIPTFCWIFQDTSGNGQIQFEIGVGTDDDWIISEMWNPPVFESPDTFSIYGGQPLIDGETYFVRMRIATVEGWSLWYEMAFHMNANPGLFSLIDPSNTDGVPEIELKPLFTWMYSVDPDPFDTVFYLLQIATDSSFQFMNQIQDLTDSQYTFINELEAGEQYWWKVKAEDHYGGLTWSSNVLNFWIMLCGDANNDKTVNISDAVYIINYVFIGGGPPIPLESGDSNCDGDCNISDAVWIINYVFVGGNDPCDTDGDGVSDC